MSPCIAAEDVSVHIAGCAVLDGVTLTVTTGEWLALVGTNGAGKSTFLDVVLGLRRPERGRVLVNGCTPPSADIGFVPQDAGASLLPWLDAEHNVALPLTLRGVSGAARARALDAVWARVPRASRIPRAAHVCGLSRGEQQLVALLRALVTVPSILVADEPFAGLDVGARSEAHMALQVLRNTGALRTALIVTHDLVDVEALTDRVHTLRTPATVRTRRAGRAGRVL